MTIFAHSLALWENAEVLLPVATDTECGWAVLVVRLPDLTRPGMWAPKYPPAGVESDIILSILGFLLLNLYHAFFTSYLREQILQLRASSLRSIRCLEILHLVLYAFALIVDNGTTHTWQKKARCIVSPSRFQLQDSHCSRLRVIALSRTGNNQCGANFQVKGSRATE